MALPYTLTAATLAKSAEVNANFSNLDTRTLALESGSVPTQATLAAAATATGLERRLELDLAAGATLTLPLAAIGLYNKPSLTIHNIGDVGTWTVALTSPDTFADAAVSVALAPGQTVMVYVGKRASGVYRWTKR